MNRRDLFKLFGAGALVAPIVNGMPEDKAIARLIEPPNIELVEDGWGVLQNGFIEQKVLDVVLYARSARTGKVARMKCESFVSSLHFFEDPPGGLLQEMTFVVTGKPPHFSIFGQTIKPCISVDSGPGSKC